MNNRQAAALASSCMEPTTQYEQVEPAGAVPPDGWRMRAVGALVLVAGLVLWLAPSQQTDAPGPRVRPGRGLPLEGALHCGHPAEQLCLNGGSNRAA